MNDTPARRPLGLHDFYAMLAVTTCWLLLALAMAVGTLRQLPLSLAVKAFVSILCGPFAFFDSPQMPWTARFVVTLFCTSLIVLHLFIREVQTAFIAVAGISLWFMIGLGMTFISV